MNYIYISLNVWFSCVPLSPHVVGKSDTTPDSDRQAVCELHVVL